MTFPTDPLQYPPGAAAELSAAAFADESGVNSRGQTYGGAAEINDDSRLPDLVAAFGSEMRPGYVKASDLRADPATDKQSSNVRVVPLLSRESEEVGTFEIGN
ncbi:hypothetical protein [Nocardia fluminea]|uniref:hypothetical protein n=1 Tax=Nocardia fluminea TaxID=134984 RepID=UPI003D13B180